jgi:hypothetical protein
VTTPETDTATDTATDGETEDGPGAAIGVTGTVSGAIPPLWFTVPGSFYALPLATTPEARAVAAAEFVRELYPNGDDAIWTPAAPYYAAAAEAMSESGLAYAAMGLFRIDNDGVGHCSFTVAAVESDHPSVEVAANGIREILVRDETNDARWLDLPCGPAVSCVTMSEATIDGQLTASGEQVTLTTGQIQVYIPFPTGPFTAVFTLDTAAVDYWGEFSDMMVEILRSVSFTAPAAPAGAEAEAVTETAGATAAAEA